MKLTYNSSRPDIIIAEYGRGIHLMVEHCASIADREERNRCARAIISTMGNLFPQLRDVEDYRHKLWDHLHVMSNFQLDVDSPYPVPSQESLAAKPRPVPYPKGNIKYGHYGKTVELIIEEVAAIEDDEKRRQASIGVANLMKRSYVVWNQNSVKDEVIANDLKKLSNGRLTVENPEEALTPTRDVIQQMGGVNTNSTPTNNQKRNKFSGRKGQFKKRK